MKDIIVPALLTFAVIAVAAGLLGAAIWNAGSTRDHKRHILDAKIEACERIESLPERNACLVLAAD